MTCAHCAATSNVFSDGSAARDLKRWRRRGPDITTRLMLDALRARPIAGAHLLDIGAGIGTLGAELRAYGVARLTHVEASAPYVAVARRFLAEQGWGDEVSFFTGDVLDAPQLASADVVTLDRAVCCYPDMPALLGRAAALTTRWLAISYPRDTAYVRPVFVLQNLVLKLLRSDFRTFVHPPAQMQQVLEAGGLRRVGRWQSFVWAVELYERAG